MSKCFCKINKNLLWFGAKVVGLSPRFMRDFTAYLIYLSLYKIIKYRLKVVRTNLKNSFPSYSEQKLKDIESKFYRHLANLTMDTITLASHKQKDIEPRIVFTNLDEVERVVNGKVGLVVSAHYASWEHSMVVPLSYSGRFYGVYHPLSSGCVDDFFIRLRSRFGLVPLPMASVAKTMVTDIRTGSSALYALISDQTPPYPVIKKWTMFLNQPTAFIMGPEKLATKYNLPIFFLSSRLVKKGYYEGTYILIYDGIEKLPEYEITKRYAKALENMIVNEPHLWMWSHRRWKHYPSCPEDII